MRYLFLTNLFLLLFITGCQSVKPRHLIPEPLSGSPGVQLPVEHNSSPIAHCLLPTFFSSPAFEKALYKATLDIRDHHLTGLLFIKKRADGGIRTIFTHEFGMTYFDLELTPETFQVIYCFGPLNKKLLWRILEHDFRLLLSPGVSAGTGKAYRQKESNSLVCYHHQNRTDRWDLYTPAGDTLVSTRGRSTMSNGAIITYSAYREGFPTSINIANPLLNLRLSLSLLSVD